MKIDRDFKGVFLNETKNKYYYLTKVKLSDGTRKSIRSKAIYDSKIACYYALLKVKDNPNLHFDSIKTNTPLAIDDNLIVKKYENRTDVTLNKTKQVKAFKVFENYYESLKKRLKPTTLAARKTYLKIYFYQYFDEETTINELCRDSVLQQYKKVILNLELSDEAKNIILMIYREIIERAFYMTLVSQNELGLVKLNLEKIRTFNNNYISKREKKFFTIEEFEKLIKIVEKENDISFSMLLKVFFYSGLRVGELLGLKGKSLIDDENCIIKIESQINILGQESTLKTKNSYRQIYMKKDIYKELKDYIFINKIKESDYIFNISRSYIREKIAKYCDLANLERLNIHGFRHSCACFWFQKFIENNLTINFRFIADQLGDNINTVQDIYLHSYGKEKQKIIDLI